MERARDRHEARQSALSLISQTTPPFKRLFVRDFPSLDHRPTPSMHLTPPHHHPVCLCQGRNESALVDDGGGGLWDPRSTILGRGPVGSGNGGRTRRRRPAPTTSHPPHRVMDVVAPPAPPGWPPRSAPKRRRLHQPTGMGSGDAVGRVVPLCFDIPPTAPHARLPRGAATRKRAAKRTPARRG